MELPLRSVFEAPTLAGLAQKDRRGADHGTASSTPIEPQPRGGELPLSFAQQRLWLIDQLTPRSALYNLPIVFRLTGALDVAALEHALQELHRRHETLRSTFVNRGGRPAVVLVGRTVHVDEVDLRASDDPARAVRERRRRTRSHGRSISRTICRGGRCCSGRQPTSTRSCVTMHHIVSDGWSLDVFADELSRSYAARQQGRPSPLGTLPIQYGDYAIWQRTHLTTDVLERPARILEAPARGRAAAARAAARSSAAPVPSYRGGDARVRARPKLSRQLEALSRDHGVTLYMTMLAAFQTLLHRSSRQDDILVGTPIAGRTRREVEGLIGFFVNTLVMRSDFSKNPTFAELLAQVRETALAAYAHQDLPFEKLVDELNPERSLSYTPLFQALFQLDRPYAANLELAGVTVNVSSSRTSGLAQVRPQHGGRARRRPARPSSSTLPATCSTNRRSSAWPSVSSGSSKLSWRVHKNMSRGSTCCFPMSEEY